MHPARLERQLLTVLLGSLLLGNPGFAKGQLLIETGGVNISLPDGWELLDQPTTFFVQKRAQNVARQISLSAGTTKLDLSLQQYTTIGAAALVKGTEGQLNFIATQVGVPRPEVDKTLASIVGRQVVDQLRQAATNMHIDLLRLFKQKLPTGTRYQVHTKMKIVDSGQVVYVRQFVLEGATIGELVTITYGGLTPEIFDMKDLADAIQPPITAKPAVQADALSYFQRGMQKGQERDYAGAVADFSKAIELNPAYAEAYHRRAQARGALAKAPNDLTAALRDYDKAIELKADFAEAYYNRGVARQASGDFAGASADYTKVIELRPDYAPAYDHRGKLRKANGDDAGAHEDLNKAAELKSR